METKTKPENSVAEPTEAETSASESSASAAGRAGEFATVTDQVTSELKDYLKAISDKKARYGIKERRSVSEDGDKRVPYQDFEPEIYGRKKD